MDYPFTADPAPVLITGAASQDYLAIVGWSVLRDHAGQPITDHDGQLIWTYGPLVPVVPCWTGSASISGVAAELTFTEGVAFINAAPGVSTVTGAATTLLKTRVSALLPATFALTGRTVRWLHNQAIVATAGEYLLTGSDQTTHKVSILDAVAGDAQLTGTAVDFTFSALDDLVAAYPDEMVVTGEGAGLAAGYAINSELAAYSISGSQLSAEARRMLNLEAGAFTITGLDLSASRLYAVMAAAGAIVTTGADPELTFVGTHKVEAEPGTFATTGVALTSLRTKVFPIGPEAIALSGREASTILGSKLNADPATQSITGAETTGSLTFVLGTDTMPFLLSGRAALLDAPSTPVLSALPGLTLFTGIQATLSAAVMINAEPELTALTGADITALLTRALYPDPESYALTGAPSFILGRYNLEAEAEDYALTGIAAGMTASGAMYLSPSPTAYLLSGRQATAWWTRAINAETGTTSLTGSDIAPVVGFGVLAESGSMAVIGSENFAYSARALVPAPGAISLTGAEIESIRTITCTAMPDSLAITGLDNSMIQSIDFPGQYLPGAFELTGSDATLAMEASLDADLRSLVLFGAAAHLYTGDFSTAPAAKTFTRPEIQLSFVREAVPATAVDEAT